MISVFIEPRRMRNWFFESLPVISLPIIAAWEEPRPGRSEHIGDIRIVASVGLIRSDFFRSSLFIVCFGGIVFCWIELIIVEVPNSPVKSGSSGFGMDEFSVEIPMNPDSAKIRIARSLDCFSFAIRKMLVHIRMNPIICWMRSYIFGIRKMKIGMIIVRDRIAIVDPISVSFMAL